MKNLVSIIFVLLFISSCQNTDTNKEMSSNDPKKVTQELSSAWVDRYDTLQAKDIPDNIIQLISEDWMLVTAGKESSYNTMTASWGAMGYVWDRPASFIFIRNSRYTYEFLEKEDSFTLSFFTEEYRGALRICGTKSGRDTDKVKEAGLTPVVTPSGLMTFAEARLVVECKKMFVSPLSTEFLTKNYKSAIVDELYTKDPTKHSLFISEITNVWLKK